MATRSRAGGKPPVDEQLGLAPNASEASPASETEEPAGDEQTFQEPEIGHTAEAVGAVEVVDTVQRQEDEVEITDDELDELEESLDLPADDAPIHNQPVATTRKNVDPVLEHATPELMLAIVACMKALKKLTKSRVNTQGNYKYASVDDFFDEAQDVLADNNLVLVADEASTGVSGYNTNQKTVGLLDSSWRFLLVLATDPTVYLGPFIRRSVAPSSMGAQAYGAVLSYAAKNYLRGQFLMATGDAEIDQTRGAPLPPRPREDRSSGQQQRREDPPGYKPRQDGPRQAGQPPASWSQHQDRNQGGDDRIPQRSRQPAGNGGGAAPGEPAQTGPRSTVFKLRGRINKTGEGTAPRLLARVLAAYAPAEKLEDLTDEQIREAHKRLDDAGVAPLQEAP